MKRFIWALPLAATCFLLCGSAFAATAATDLPADVGKHLVVSLIAAFLPPLVKALNEGTQRLPTIAQPFRLAIILVLGGVATVIDQWGQGMQLGAAAVAFLVASGPSILIETVHAIWGGWPSAAGGNSGTGGIGGGDSSVNGGDAGTKTGMRPPAGYSTKLGSAATGVAIGFCVLAMTGCATLKNVPAVVRDASNEVITDAQDAKAIVDALHSTASIFFLIHPDAPTQAKVEQAFGDVDLALDVAIRASNGAKASSDGEYDLAFANFRAAYVALTRILSDLGVMSPKFANDKFSVARGGGGVIDMPIPRASIARVKQ